MIGSDNKIIKTNFSKKETPSLKSGDNFSNEIND